MRSAYILVVLALMVPLVFSAPASDTRIGGAAIDVQTPSSEHAPDEATKASEYFLWAQ
jgi:hypothetical protein